MCWKSTGYFRKNGVLLHSSVELFYCGRYFINNVFKGWVRSSVRSHELRFSPRDTYCCSNYCVCYRPINIERHSTTFGYQVETLQPGTTGVIRGEVNTEEKVEESFPFFCSPLPSAVVELVLIFIARERSRHSLFPRRLNRQSIFVSN